MSDQKLEIKTGIQILKPVSEVYEAIADPAKMSNYFISESTGRMEAGKELVWRFPEFDMDVPIRVGRMEADKYISYYWTMDELEHLVEMNLSPCDDGNATVLIITEKSRENDAAGIKWLQGNTEGWANFLACLKAWVEYGIHLRKGAFEYRKK